MRLMAFAAAGVGVLTALLTQVPVDDPYQRAAHLAIWSYVVLNSNECAGVVFDGGKVLTAAHCLKESDNQVTAWAANGRTPRSAVVLDKDVGRDIAVLSVDWGPLQGRMRDAEFAERYDPGTPVVLAGTPLGEAGLLTFGHVAKIQVMNFENTCDRSPYGTTRTEQVLHTAMTFGGSSGGGLFDLSGRLVGVTHRMRTWSPFGCEGPLLEALWGYAISARSIREWLTSRPWYGGRR